MMMIPMLDQTNARRLLLEDHEKAMTIENETREHLPHALSLHDPFGPFLKEKQLPTHPVDCI